MKIFILALAFLATSAFAESDNVDIDWSNVRPIEFYPKFWDNKPFRPPATFFAQYESKRNGRIVGGNIAK